MKSLRSDTHSGSSRGSWLHAVRNSVATPFESLFCNAFSATSRCTRATGWSKKSACGSTTTWLLPHGLMWRGGCHTGGGVAFTPAVDRWRHASAARRRLLVTWVARSIRNDGGGCSTTQENVLMHRCEWGKAVVFRNRIRTMMLEALPPTSGTSTRCVVAAGCTLLCGGAATMPSHAP